MKASQHPILIGALVSCLVAGSSLAVTLSHEYGLNGTLADSLGGPAMVTGGGILGASGYTFGPGQGPSLSGAIDAADYTIEMLFNIDQIDGYRRLIDFKNLGSDTGLYNLNTALNFYDETTGPAGAFAANGDVTLVVTRDGGTNLFVGYVNGVQQISFTDSASLATFTSDIAYFFVDDTVFPGEIAGGFLDRVRIYDGAATADQVAAGLPGASVPDGGATVALLGLALSGMAVVRRKFNRS